MRQLHPGPAKVNLVERVVMARCFTTVVTPQEEKRKGGPRNLEEPPPAGWNSLSQLSLLTEALGE